MLIKFAVESALSFSVVRHTEVNHRNCVIILNHALIALAGVFGTSYHMVWKHNDVITVSAHIKMVTKYCPTIEKGTK